MNCQCSEKIHMYLESYSKNSINIKSCSEKMSLPGSYSGKMSLP